MQIRSVQRNTVQPDHRNQIRLSNEAVLVKCNSRFCSYVASFFPQKFSETYFSALLSGKMGSFEIRPQCWKWQSKHEARTPNLPMNTAFSYVTPLEGKRSGEEGWKGINLRSQGVRIENCWLWPQKHPWNLVNCCMHGKTDSQTDLQL